MIPSHVYWVTGIGVLYCRIALKVREPGRLPIIQRYRAHDVRNVRPMAGHTDLIVRVAQTLSQAADRLSNLRTNQQK